MANLYQDQVKKLTYYRSRIVQDLARKGIYPDDFRVKSRLNDIDTMLGVFQYMNVGVGDVFDTAKFNEDFTRIYVDLKILYELAYEISVRDFNELQIYCETHLNELQAMADNYRYKTRLELDSTYLGQTVLYQSTGFDSALNNGILTVKLGTVEVEAQSRLACIIDSDTISSNNVVFTLTDSNGTVHNCSPYDYNHDFFTVPGTLKCNTYTYALSDDIIKTQFICTPSKIAGNVNYNNKYILYGAKDFIQLGYYSKSYIQKFANTPITIDGGIVTFYILGGTYANFEFSDMPDNKNFEGVNITDMPAVQKITIEHTRQLSFDFITNGTVYATRQKGKIVNGDLYYPVPDQIRDVLIEEYSVGDKKSYNVTVTAGPFTDGNIPVINAIAIKQISALEDIS